MGKTATSIHPLARRAGLTPKDIRQILDPFLNVPTAQARTLWLSHVAGLVSSLRPDLGSACARFLKVKTAPDSCLKDLGIVDISVLYEAMLALLDGGSRRSSGQFFTPADVAEFMAEQAAKFPSGSWLDPCCGIGNLSWYLAAAQADPDEFVREQLTLADLDETALKTAISLMVASFARPEKAIHPDSEAEDESREASGKRKNKPAKTNPFTQLARRCLVGDFLDKKTKLKTDFAILNPPYAASDKAYGLVCDSTRELYAQFLEKVMASTRGMVAITPSSFIHAKKFAPVRQMLLAREGFRIFSFDNVPDTIFRGFKFGSVNTSVTNFVRAAITVTGPQITVKQLTPIVRWKQTSRERMFQVLPELLADFQMDWDGQIDQGGNWLRLHPDTLPIWQKLRGCRRLDELLVGGKTEFALEVASSPRYYLSASKRPLNRLSKKVLYFDSAQDRDLAYVLLNSSLPYWWWRTVDGGFTVSLKTLQTLPIPPKLTAKVAAGLVPQIEASEAANVVTKLNGGRLNENIKHPQELVDSLNRALLGKGSPPLFREVYSPDMISEL